MATMISILLFLCLASVPRRVACKKTMRPFWRKQLIKQKLTALPTFEKDPEFYRKLREDIPPKIVTAQKVIKNILRVFSGIKRSVKLEDVVIVMDGSSSIGSCEFDNGKKAMKSLMLYKQSEINAKYAMVTFSNDVKVNFNFWPQKMAAAKLQFVKFFGGSTNTQAGLAEALKLFKKGSRGSSTRKVVLLLTDGQSNIQRKKTVPNADKLKEAGIEVFVIAVGGQHMHGIVEMAKVASFPPADFLFRVKKVGDFLEVVKLAIKKVAPDKYKIVEKYKSTC